MALDDIIKRHKQYLTNAQIKSLAELSEKYKQVNAQRRAEAYGNLYTNHQTFRRGLQNMGLASRRGNLISGREVMGRVNVEDTYHRFNDQLRVGEDRMTENQAIRYANDTIKARNEAAQRAREEYEKQLAEAQAFRKKQIDAQQVDLQSTDDPNQYDPFKHTTAENLEIFRMQAKQSGMKRSEINTYAAQQAAAVEKERANRKALAESALAQKSVIDKETIAKDVLPIAKERMVTDSFLQNYGLSRESYNKLKATNPEAAQQIDTRVQQLYAELQKNSAQWQKDIAAGNEKVGLGSGDTAENTEAQNRADNARLAIAKVNTELARLSGAVQNPEYANLYLMTDDEFSVAYDAAEKLYQKRMQEAISKEHSFDKPSTTGYTPQMRYRGNMGSDVAAQAKQSAAQKEAEAMRGEALRDFSGFIQAKHDRSQVVEIEALAQQFDVPDKTVKDEYGTVDVRKSQKNWQGVAWANPYEWDGTNWKNAHDHNYDPSKYEETHDTKGSKYDALVNEWAFINGRTALLYTQKFQTVSDVANIGEFIGYVFGGEVNRNEAYNLFRNDCVMAFNHDWEDSGTKSQKEQMDAYLTLANLMTDEERERFNALKEQMGGKYADEYFEHLYNDVLPARLASYLEKELGFQTRDPLGRIESSLMSVPVNLTQGISGPIHSWTTKQDDSVAAQLGAMKYNTAQNMRNAVMENYSERGRFWYGTAMSMADSAVVAAISSGIGNVASAALKGVGMGAEMAANVGGKIGSVLGGSILGGSAYNSAYDEALQRGLSPEKARQTAFGTGMNEMLFESLSLDLLVSRFKVGDMLKVSKNGFVNYVVNTLVEAGVEGSEEVFTDMANRMWDNGINDVFSEELTTVRKYMADGMSYEEAKRKVDEEFGAQLWESFKGGFVSGGVMGGAAGAMHNIQTRDYERIGNNMDAATKAELDTFKFTDEQAQEIQQQSKKTNQDYGVLAVTRAMESMQTDPMNAYKAVQSILDTQTRTEIKVDKRNQTLKTGTENSVSFNYDGVTDVKKMSGVQVEALRFAQTLVKSKVGGVNINVANQLYDKNGNEQNGWYDPKTNTVHVSLNGSQSVVYTISHELTHRLKEGNKEAYASLRDAMKSELESLDLLGSDLPSDYSDILGDYLVKDGVQRTAWEALIDYEMDRYAKHDIKLDREAAEEEVVCRACETMLEKSRLISSMVSRNVRSAKKIAKLLASISDDIEALKAEAESRGYEDGSPEKMFIDQYANIEKIANAWASAMKTVAQEETKKIVKEEGRGGTAFSLKQELRDDGQSLADKSMKYRKAHKAESQHISDDMLEAANKQIHRMAQRMLPFLTLKNEKNGKAYLPDEVLGKTQFGNSSYGGKSIENTTICFRTLAYIDFTNEIKKQIGRPLTVSESFLASQMLYQIAKEPQCLYCYVSLDRKAYDEQLLSYIKQRDKVVEAYNKLSYDERQKVTDATRNAVKSIDAPLYKEFLAGRKDTAQMRTRFAQWIDIANSGSEAITAADLATDERRGLMRNGDDWKEAKRTTGKVSLQDQVIDAERYAQGASWAKKMEEYRAYNGDILSIGKRTVNKLNHEYGLRFYSFSEYTPAFIVENMQQIRDAALKGLMGLAYTKKTDFARIFAGTGMNINISTFGRWGVDADGNRVVVMDADQGADWTEVQNLRKQFDNVGGVFVATDDAMTEWAMKQDWIDVVIPFHIVRTGANVAEFYKWVVHNNEQNDVTAEGKNATIPAAEHGNSYDKYMKLCEDRGLTPRFNKWNPKNNPNVTEDEYMKLVNETRRTLDETNPLQPVYNTREAARSFGRFVHDGGYYGDYYKAKSEQDIKVPITPEQDILGIGSQTYSEQEGIDRVVADIKAGNKANQVPYGRQDIDEQISRLNKARQMKQHGQKFSVKEGAKLSVSPVSDAVSSEANVRFSVREGAAPTKTRDVYKLMRLGKDGRLYPLFIDSAEGIDLGVWYNADSPDMSVLKTLPSGVYLVGDNGKDIVTLADYQRDHGEKSSKFPSKAAINSAATDGKRWVFIEDVAKGQRRYGGENRKYWNLGINGSGSVSTFAMRPGWHAGSLPTMRQIGKGANKNLRDDTFVWVKGRVSADVDYQAEAERNPDSDIPTHIPTDGFYMKSTNANAAAAQADKVGWYIAGAFIADRIIGDAEARSIIDKWNEEHPSDHVEYDYERESGGEFDAETMSIRNPKYSLKEGEERANRTYSMKEFERLYEKGVRPARVKELSAFKNKTIRDITPDNIVSLALKRVQSNSYKNDRAGYVYFDSTNTKATVTEKSFRHGRGDNSVEYLIACMNISELAKSAIPVNELNLSENHTNPGTIYFAIAQTNRSAFLVRMVVENGTGELDGLNVLYAIKKESPSTTSASAQSQTVTRDDVIPAHLKKRDELMRTSSNINIKDFLKVVNSFRMGKSSLSMDVLQELGSTRHNEPRVTPYLKYSIKDNIDKLGGQEYLKYLQLGAKVVNQTATEAEIKEFKQRMVQLSEDNRMAFLDKLREKMIRADEAAKVREVRDRQIARLKEEFKESKEKARERRIRSDLTATLKKGNDRIVQLLSRPTENAHVPVQLAQAVSEYAMRLNDLLTKSEPKTGEFAGQEKQTQKGALNAQKILDALKRSYADAETIEMLKAEDPKFDPRGLIPVQYDENGKMIKDDSLAEMVRGMDEIIQGKHLNDLTTDELRYVMNTMRGVIYAVTEANKVTVDGESRDVYRTSRKMANEVKSASKVFGNKSSAITKFLNRYVVESLGLRRIAKLYSGSDENATFVKLVDGLNEGAIEQERIKQTLRAMFNEVTEKYEKDMKSWYGKNAEWIDTGFGFKITKGMRVSLAMHILNEQNLRNVEKAGLRIPEQSAYRKGNYKEAYKNGKVVRLTKAQAEQIVSHMTEAEKAYFEVAKEFFHKQSGKYINRTSLKLLGFSKAIVDNYFPIQTDDAYRTVKYDDVHQNASVEHPGFLESRKGTANVMYLNDINAVVNRQIEGVAKYAGLAIPMRAWNNVMNAWLFEENENGEWARSDEGRPHDVLERRMGYTNGKGKAIMDYVDQFITDLSSGGVSNANDDVQAGEFAAKLTSNYVKAVLTLNARVALSQLASVPTAAAEIPWKYIAQSFAGNVEQHLNRNASNELIDMYTPIFAMRRAGTQTEVSEIMKRKGLSDKAEQKLPWALGWITAMDTAATRRLWYACERWVKGETNIPVGSDAFYKEVAKRYERVIQNTQPNFTVLQRSPALRSKNAAARIITMFGTQRMQNAGVFIESLAEVVQAKDKATRKTALKRFGRTLSGLITAAIVIGLERAIVSALRGRMKPLQDEDKEITAKSVDKYIRGEIGTSLAGSFMYVGEIYDFVNSIVSGFTEGDTGYETSFALPAAEALSTMIQFFKDAVPFMLNINAVDENGKPKYDDHQKWLKTKSFINGLMTAASYATGLPLQNASKTILNGWLPLGQDIADAIKTGEFIPYLHQSGKLDSSKTAANYKEWTNDGKNGSTYLYWEKKWKEISNDKTQPNASTLSEMLMRDSSMSAEDKATLYRMLYGNDRTSNGGIVYTSAGNVDVDFTDENSYLASTELSDAKYEGYQKMIADGIPEDLALVSYRQYTAQQKRGAGANDRFHEWLFNTVKDPHQRAVIDMYVIGNTNSVNGNIGYKDGEVSRDYSTKEWYDMSAKPKQYKYAKELAKSGLTDSKAIALIQQFNDVKKADSEQYLQGLTEAQKKIIYEYKGWKW